MKKLFVFAIATMFAFSMSAQKFGVKAGMNMSGYTVNFYTPDGAKMGMGFNAGLVGEMPVNDMMSLRADLTFSQLGSAYDSRDESAESWGMRDFYEFDSKSKVNYLNIAVSPKFNFGPAYAFVGPYFAYAISAPSTGKITPVEGDVQEWTVNIFDEPSTTFDYTKPLSDDNNQGGSGDLFNKMDFGFNLGLGANFSGVFVEANVGLGLMNYYNTDSKYYDQTTFATKDDMKVALTDKASQKNLFFGLSVGYLLGGE